MVNAMRVERFLLNAVAGNELCPCSLRRWIYKAFGNDVTNAKIFSNCFIGGSGLFVGENSFINHECFFDLSGSIVIGKECNIGMRCVFITGTHNIGDSRRRAVSIVKKNIFIGDGAWLGANVTVLPGCNIGCGCVIAAGAVVTGNCEKNCLYAGVPARMIKKLSK